MTYIPYIAFFVRRLFLLQVVVLVLSNFHKGSPYKSLSASATDLGNSKKKNLGGAGGFNYEIEKRVHERVSELMSVPVTMLGLVEQYSKTDVFEPPFLRPHQKDDIFRFLWTVWKEFNIDLYYGQEDGLFLGIIKGAGTYQEGRGSNGYLLEEISDGNNQRELTEEDAYFKRLYYDECLDPEMGTAQNCTLKVMEDYVSCVDNCELSPCPSSSPSTHISTSKKVLVSAEDIEFGTTEEPTIYCPTYDIQKVPNDYAMGYIPRYYYCLDNAGKFIENDPPNSVASPSSMQDGVCTHSDGVTLVDGRVATKKTYAMADRRNYLFLGDYDNIYASEEQADAAAHFLYTDDPINVLESQKTDQVFVGGHHSRRYEPRLRPWYLGTREVQNAFWTKPYPFATNNDMGISYGKPLYYTDPSTGQRVFRGVICVDYDLEEISRFLRDVFLDIVEENAEREDENMYSSSSGAAVLIVEDDAPHYIIGSSTGSKAAKKVGKDDETINCEDEDIFSRDLECKTVRSTPQDYLRNTKVALDGVMAMAFQAQKEEGFPKKLVVSAAPVDDDDDDGLPDFYVSQSLIYEQSEGQNLKWRIIVTMPVGVATNDDLYYGDPIFVVVLAVGVFACLACLVLFYYYFSKRKRTEIRMSDWRFTSAFILGCALLNLTTLTYIGQSTDATCMFRMWAFHFVFVLALAPLLVKVWRIFKLAGSADRAVRLSITNQKAMLYTMPPILLQVLILTLFSIFDPAKLYTYVDIDGSSSFQHSVCRHDTAAFTITQVVFEGGLVLTGCILAFKTRNLGSALGEAKQLIFAMYNVALVSVIVLLMGSLLHIDQKSVYVIMTVGIFWATVFSSCAFVLPRILQVQRNSMRERGNGFGRTSSYYGRKSSGSFYASNGSVTAPPKAPTSAPMYVGGSLYNEPGGKTALDSIHSSDYNDKNSHSESQVKPSTPSTVKNDVRDRTFNSLAIDEFEGELHDSNCETSIKEKDDEKQKHRNTSFTKISISPSESDILNELDGSESLDNCDMLEGDIEANIMFDTTDDGDEKE